MKKIIFLTAAFGILWVFKVNAQEGENNFGIKFSGFVKNDFILDSRQVVSARDGHFLLYPTNENLDIEGNDINARASFNYLAIQSRLTGKITGPDAFGAKTSGVIEGAFFGQAEGNINSFRLRHAYVKLNWSTTEVILGQYWHTFFVTECFPGTVSFNTGVPFQFFSRNPQISISQKLGSITLTGSAATQLDFQSPGGAITLRNALLPDLSGRLIYSPNDNFLGGLTLGYKQLMPRLVTENNFSETSTVGGAKAQAFMKIVTTPITFKLQGIYAQNAFDGLMLGGFAIKSISDQLRDYRDYTAISNFSAWTDIHTNGKKIQGGVFIGYTQNLGSSEEIEELDSYGNFTRGANIASIYRISPRVIVNSGKIRFAMEIEHTSAEYGSSIDLKGIPTNTKTINNTRVLVAVYYFF